MTQPDLIEILLALGSRDYPGGPCWCAMAIGDPRVSRHSETCLAARRAVAEYRAAGGHADGGDR